MTVDERTIADTHVTCVTTTPKAGTALDGTGPGTDMLCLSDEGAQLLVDHAGERLVADSYSTDGPQGDLRRLRSTSHMAELRAFEAVNQYFAEAAAIIDLDAELHAVLTTPYREITVQVPVRLDDGELIVVRGYRVQHNGARGPVQGRHPLPPDAPTSTRCGRWPR